MLSFDTILSGSKIFSRTEKLFSHYVKQMPFLFLWNVLSFLHWGCWFVSVLCFMFSIADYTNKIDEVQ